MRILILDDYRSHGESLAELLGSIGHEATYAETYSDAEWLLDLLRFDIALLDFDMPGLSGPAVAARLAARFPRIRSVIMSARKPTPARLKEIGSLPFLEKPVPMAVLLELLRDVERELLGVALVQRTAFSVVKYGRQNRHK